MAKEKIYTKAQLDRAYKSEGSFTKAAEKLECGYKTFKKNWNRTHPEDSQGTSKSDDVIQSSIRSPFRDPKVEKIVTDHRKDRDSVEGNLKCIILEMVDRIDKNDKAIAELQAENERTKKHLHEMKF